MSGYPSITLSGVGSSAPMVVSPPTNMLWQAAPSYLLGLYCTVSSGANLTYTVQVTADQVPSANGHWNNHDVLVNQTASLSSNIAYPVSAVRLTVTARSSGTVNLGVAQWP